jgi:hypothetical protein
MTDDTTRIRLPHTGLRVPDRSLSITGYRARPADCGAWFTANINVNGQLVGQIRNNGDGSPTTLFADSDHPIYGDAEVALAGYARYCRTEEGARLGLEELLDELVAEHEWTLKIADAEKKHRMLLRLMALLAEGFPPRSPEDTTSEVPQQPKHWNALRRALTGHTRLAPGKGTWWQAWYQNRWQDATRRPAKVDSDLYR